MSNFRLSVKSFRNMAGLHSDQVRLVARAIDLTEVDFFVNQGTRTVAQQRRLVDEGKSQTMDSRHIGGFAVDLVAWVDGGPSWDFDRHYVPIAEAMRNAAMNLDLPLIWGAAWHRDLRDFPSARAAYEDYIAECNREGRDPFVDGPHFHLPRDMYPNNEGIE